MFAAPGDDELMAWFRTGHADLVATLSGADPGIACWSFLPAPSPLAFWSRRQAHETAIHRADAQSAAATITGYPTDFAADGIDAALGHHDPIPDRLLTEALARIISLAPLFEHFRSIDFYAPPIAVEADADPHQRLLAFLGRPELPHEDTVLT